MNRQIERDIRICPCCNQEVERGEMDFTRDCHGIAFRRKRTVVHATAREHQRSSFGGIVIVSDVAVGSASYIYRQFVLWMQAVVSHLFDVTFVCRAYVADLFKVSGVCRVCAVRALITAVMLAVLDIDSVSELPHVSEPVLNPMVRGGNHNEK